MSKNLRLLFLLLALINQLGCVAPAKTNVFVSEREGLEVESIDEQLTSELSGYPLSFRVSEVERARCIERAIFFFKTYTSAEQKSLTTQAKTWTNKGSKDPTWITVQRSTVRGGERFVVKAEKADKPLAAQNVARFIAEGQLELSLLGHSR